MDWNEDGKKDLVVGEYDGHVRIYLNMNTDSSPQFSGYTYVQVAGSDLDVGLTSTPFIIDWDNDSRKDLIVGESSGRVRPTTLHAVASA